MANEIIQEDLKILQRADSNLPKYMYGLDDIHFAKIVANARKNGLLYVAENTLNKFILPIDAIREDKNLGAVILSTSDPRCFGKKIEVAVGSPEFLEYALADAYVGGYCGCQIPYDNGLDIFKPLEALLPFGSVYYNILADGCGQPFSERKDDFTENSSQECFIQAHRWNPNPITNHYAKVRNLPKGLAQRLHIITTLNGGR